MSREWHEPVVANRCAEQCQGHVCCRTLKHADEEHRCFCDELWGEQY